MFDTQTKVALRYGHVLHIAFVTTYIVWLSESKASCSYSLPTAWGSFASRALFQCFLWTTKIKTLIIYGFMTLIWVKCFVLHDYFLLNLHANVWIVYIQLSISLFYPSASYYVSVYTHAILKSVRFILIARKNERRLSSLF